MAHPCRWLLPVSICLVLAAGSAVAQEAPPKKDGPPAGGPANKKDKPEINWENFTVRLRDNRFAFHQRDVTGKEWSSSDYWGKPHIVVIDLPKSRVGAEAIRLLHKICKSYSGAAVVPLYLVDPELEDGHIKKLAAFVKQEKLEGLPALMGGRRIHQQFEQSLSTFPVLVYVNRDGTVETTSYGWVANDRGDEGPSEGLISKHVREVLTRMAGKPKPAGTAPEPPELEIIYGLQKARDTSGARPVGGGSGE